MSNRDTLAQLQAHMSEGDALMVRALEDLKELGDAIDEIETIYRLRSVAMTAAASFIAESRALLEEAAGDPAATFAGDMLSAMTRQ